MATYPDRSEIEERIRLLEQRLGVEMPDPPEPPGDSIIERAYVRARLQVLLEALEVAQRKGTKWTGSPGSGC